jgi:hypothetical protein
VNQICFARQSTETSSSLSSDNESSLSWPKAGKTATAFALAAFSLFCFRNISIRSNMVLSVQTKQNFVNHTASTMMVSCNEQQLWQQGYYYQQDHVMAFKQANSMGTNTTATKEVENQRKYQYHVSKLMKPVGPKETKNPLPLLQLLTLFSLLCCFILYTRSSNC